MRNLISKISRIFHRDTLDVAGDTSQKPMADILASVNRLVLIQGNRDIGPVDRPNIEAAAREGYLDRIAGREFSHHYDAAPPPWQRNYEIGRLWATGMIRCGITPPDWPAQLLRQPLAIDDALVRVNARIGALRPETDGPMPPDPHLPTLHVPVLVPRRSSFSRRRRHG